MKNKTKYLCFVLAMILTVSAIVPMFSCGPKTPADGTTDPSETTPSETTTAAPKPVLPLTALTFDDAAYSVKLDGSDKYTVSLPAGRSRIPLITATAGEGTTVEVIQAVIPDSKTEGDAKITVTDGTDTKVYTVTFKRDASLGFHLQFDDYYTFTPNYTPSRTVSPLPSRAATRLLRL